MADFAVVSVRCAPPISEILMAEMSELGFESFLEDERGFSGSVTIKKFDEKILKNLFQRYQGENIEWKTNLVEKENWNKKWEENYSQVRIDNEILIRAPFHDPDTSYKYDLIITPKMSFGTGHHETTELMLRQQLETDFMNKKVLDAGSGTGILAIMASKLGAETITCCDIEEWAIENAIENFQMNDTEATVYHGTVEVLPEQNYDIILANINKNVLMNQLEFYANHLNEDGVLFLSGFYETDVNQMEEACSEYNLKKIKERSKNNWALLTLRKQKN